MKSIRNKSVLKPPKVYNKSKSGKPIFSNKDFKEMNSKEDITQVQVERLISSQNISIHNRLLDKPSTKSITTDYSSNQHQVKVIVRFRPFIESEKVYHIFI